MSQHKFEIGQAVQFVGKYRHGQTGIVVQHIAAASCTLYAVKCVDATCHSGCIVADTPARELIASDRNPADVRADLRAAKFDWVIGRANAIIASN